VRRRFAERTAVLRSPKAAYLTWSAERTDTPSLCGSGDVEWAVTRYPASQGAAVITTIKF